MAGYLESDAHLAIAAAVRKLGYSVFGKRTNESFVGKATVHWGYSCPTNSVKVGTTCLEAGLDRLRALGTATLHALHLKSLIVVFVDCGVHAWEALPACAWVLVRALAVNHWHVTTWPHTTQKRKPGVLAQTYFSPQLGPKNTAGSRD